MKILLYGINFAPELTGVGKYTGELAAWLAARGHKVHLGHRPAVLPGLHRQPRLQRPRLSA
jgi:colanic acid biosynthesis glycosyl transferase WcaI